MVLTGCTSQPEAQCPIENLSKRDAVADARAALANGDRHLLMVGGFVGTVPGVEDSESYPTRMMEGTSDTDIRRCAGQRAAAEAYAAKYNQTVVRATAR
jgi:hypothetical protein